MRNRMYGGVRGRKMKVGGKLLHFPPTRFVLLNPQKLCFTHHPTPKSSETPMYKGIEASVG